LRDFKKDVTDLFDRKRGGHVQHWLYTDAMRETLTGSDLWRAFTRSSRGYYIPRDEAELIRRHGGRLTRETKIDTVVDFGVGSRIALTRKVLPLIKGLSTVKIYAGVDVSKKFLERAALVMRQHRPDLAFEAHHRDFYEDVLKLGGVKRLGLLFGCCVTNQDMMEGQPFPRGAIVQHLQAFRRHLGSSDEMLITYDANDNPDAAMAAYDNSYWSKHVTGLMYDVNRLLKTGGSFDPAAWQHIMLWDASANVVHQCVAATKAQTLVMGEREYHFAEGERFVAVNNFKFPDPVFQELCDDAGFERKKVANLNTLRLQHLRVG